MLEGEWAEAMFNKCYGRRATAVLVPAVSHFKNTIRYFKSIFIDFVPFQEFRPSNKAFSMS